MSKIIQAFLSGMLYTFIVDFFLFLGIMLNYIKHYDINVYYNILFADHQNGFLYFGASILFGYLIMYLKNIKVMLSILGVVLLLALTLLLPSIGYKAGETLLMKKNVTFKDKRYTYTGDIYYEGRKQITFYDYELKKIILLNKKDLKR